MKTLSIVAITAFAFLSLADFASAQGVFTVSSTSFKNNMTLQLNQIFNRLRIRESNGVIVGTGNECSPNGDPGGNQSPQLSWTNVPPRTTSFAVLAYDSTAEVYHWGMYNIPRTTTSLPENAGAAASTAGLQTVNVYGRLGYGGPCPPPNDPRGDPHNYVFTVYALAQPFTEAQLPLNSDTAALANALLTVRLADGTFNFLDSDNITGLWSSTPPTP